MPLWDSLLVLQQHAEGLPVTDSVGGEIKAIQESRSLLEGDDAITPLISDLAQALREAITSNYSNRTEAITNATSNLNADCKWNELSESDRDQLIVKHQLSALATPQIGTLNELLAELNKATLSARHSALEAIPQRATNALNEAVKILTPNAKPVTLLRCSLDTEEEVNQWIDDTKIKLLNAISTGPIILN